MDRDNISDKYESLSHIGERIRAIRQRRGITQAELAGNDITRNMLSRIENGAALPSLTTLCAISERLDMPVGALLGDLEDYVNRKLSDEIRGLISQKKYLKAIEIYNSSEHKHITDDMATMLGTAFLGRAEELYFGGKLTAALENLDSAEKFFKLSSRGDSMPDKLFLLRTMILDSTALRHEVPDSDISLSEKRLRQMVFDCNGMAIYLYCKARIGSIASKPYSEPHESAGTLRAELMPLINGIDDDVYRLHIDAKLYMAEADYLSAKAKLSSLVAESGRAPSLTYDLYADLEFCCKCCGDFENAYRYSGLRLELLKKIT